MKLLKTLFLDHGTELRLLLGDLTMAETDAIVNAANERLQHGAGVAGAIVRRGGQVIQAESDSWVREHGPVTHDRPAITLAGDLPSKAVIHVVGPRWGEGDEERKLDRAITSALELAQEQELRSLAFPAISTGIFGFPMDRAAAVILNAIETYITAQEVPSLQRIDIVLFDQPAADTFSFAIQERWPNKST